MLTSENHNAPVTYGIYIYMEYVCVYIYGIYIYIYGIYIYIYGSLEISMRFSMNHSQMAEKRDLTKTRKSWDLWK